MTVLREFEAGFESAALDFLTLLFLAFRLYFGGQLLFPLEVTLVEGAQVSSLGVMGIS